MRVVLVGVAIGALVALAAAGWLEPLLYEASPRDPLTYGAVLVGAAGASRQGRRPRHLRAMRARAG